MVSGVIPPNHLQGKAGYRVYSGMAVYPVQPLPSIFGLVGIKSLAIHPVASASFLVCEAHRSRRAPRPGANTRSGCLASSGAGSTSSGPRWGPPESRRHGRVKVRTLEGGGGVPAIRPEIGEPPRKGGFLLASLSDHPKNSPKRHTHIVFREPTWVR